MPGIGRLERVKKASHATYKQLQWRIEVEPEENREKKRATVPDTAYKGAGQYPKERYRKEDKEKECAHDSHAFKSRLMVSL